MGGEKDVTIFSKKSCLRPIQGFQVMRGRLPRQDLGLLFWFLVLRWIPVSAHSARVKDGREQLWPACCLPCLPLPQCCFALALAQTGPKFIQVQLMFSFRLTKAEDRAQEALWPLSPGPWKLQAVCCALFLDVLAVGRCWLISQDSEVTQV